MLVNVRSYNGQVRAGVLAAIERIARGECAASGSPREPDFEYFDQFPLTDNDAAVTARVSAAFTAHFAPEAVTTAERQTASEDFGRIPEAFGAPYTYWLLGGCDPQAYATAAANGTTSRDIPANHSPFFAPLVEPTLSTGVQALVVAAMAYLGTHA